MLLGATIRPHWNAASRASVAISTPTAETTKLPRSAVTDASAMTGRAIARRIRAPSAIAAADIQSIARPLTTMTRASRIIGRATRAPTAVQIFATTRSTRRTGRVSQNAVVPTRRSPWTSCTASATSNPASITVSRNEASDSAFSRFRWLMRASIPDPTSVARAATSPRNTASHARCSPRSLRIRWTTRPIIACAPPRAARLPPRPARRLRSSGTSARAP